MTENRTPAGVPTGGQFAASQRAETDLTLSAAPPVYAPAGHADDEPRGDAENGSPCPFCGQEVWYERRATGLPMRWVHRDSTPRCASTADAVEQWIRRQTPLSQTPAATGLLTIKEEALRTVDPFEMIQVVNDQNGDGFHVAPVTSTNMVDGLTAEVCRQQGYDPSDVEEWVEAEKASNAYLRTNHDKIHAWAQEVYSAEVHPGCDPQHQYVSCKATLGPDARTDEVFDAANGTRIGEVDEALRSGEFYARMLNEVG